MEDSNYIEESIFEGVFQKTARGERIVGVDIEDDEYKQHMPIRKIKTQAQFERLNTHQGTNYNTAVNQLEDDINYDLYSQNNPKKNKQEDEKQILNELNLEPIVDVSEIQFQEALN